MTHISEINKVNEKPVHLNRLVIGGLTLRDTYHTERPARTYDIPEGIAVDIPLEIPLAKLKFSDGTVDMDTLKQLIVNAKGFHIPESIGISFEFPIDGSPTKIITTNHVATEIIQFYVEANQPYGYVIHQNFEQPSVLINGRVLTTPSHIVDRKSAQRDTDI